MKESCKFSEFLRLARIRQSEGGLSSIRQLLELSILFPVYKVGPGFYQMAGFWKKGTPWSAKTGHLNPTQYRRIVDKLNPVAYRKLSQNKLSETALLRLFQIPSPEYLGYYNSYAGKDAAGNDLCSIENLHNFLIRHKDKKRICFKPLEGWAGQGFEAAEISVKDNITSLLRLKTNHVLTPEEFKRDVIDKCHNGSSIIEAYLEQHPSLAAFNPSSVNTMRLWIARAHDAEPQVLLGYLRIGRDGSLIDNQSSGGIVAPIDLETGKLSKAIDGLYQHNIYKIHPDHCAIIEGKTLPFFDESLTLAKHALMAFPGARFAGADIAISTNGPQVIEINLSPDREGAAFVGKPSKEIFAIVEQFKQQTDCGEGSH